VGCGFADESLNLELMLALARMTSAQSDGQGTTHYDAKQKRARSIEFHGMGPEGVDKRHLRRLRPVQAGMFIV